MRYPFGILCQLLMLTGKRRAERACAKRSEINEEGRRLEVPRLRYKGRRDHIVPLSEPVRQLLGAIPYLGRSTTTICSPPKRSKSRTTILTKAGVHISIDGRARCMDNVRPYAQIGGAPGLTHRAPLAALKHEAVYLVELTDGFHARRVVDDWIAFYNAKRPHTALGGVTPNEAYGSRKQERMAA